MTTINLRAIKFNGYKIELSENMKGKPVARLSKFITAGKNKGTYKFEQGYFFATEERRKEWVEEKMGVIKNFARHQDERKNEKSNARKNMVNPFKVGQLFYDSWGYDQTNIDFYQIVSVKEKSVMLQKIGQKMVEGSDGGFMCEYVTPNTEIKLGEQMMKPVQVQVGSDGVIGYRINGYRGSIWEYTQGEKGIYQSHYA